MKLLRLHAFCDILFPLELTFFHKYIIDSFFLKTTTKLFAETRTDDSHSPGLKIRSEMFKGKDVAVAAVSV